MPSSFRFQPNALANAGWDETPDWAVSDYPIFEKAVNTGAPMRRPAAWDGGGEVIKTASRKEPSALESAKKFAIEQLGVPPGKVNEVLLYGAGYAIRDPEGVKILKEMSKNKPGTITRQQEAELQEVFRDPKNKNAGAMREKYNEWISSGRLRVIP